MIDGNVQLFNLRKRLPFGPDELAKDWGIRPEQVIDFQALVGDSVDNVPGVPGIGPKTASQLLQEFGTLENVLANIDKIAGKKRQESLREAVKEIPRTRELVRLATDVPIKLDWDAWRLREVDVEKFLALCREWGFHSLANQVRNLSVVRGPSSVARRVPALG